MLQSPQNAVSAVLDEITDSTAVAADPAGAIRLLRRNQAFTRTRVLAGLKPGSGVVVDALTCNTVSVSL
ncbi:hypothetical protein ACIQGZ_19385 [Streptomyces sp. NPDC092296]|uniref:hypothetical protein n=1 Tax=Streptomyces sp. NPDC092296 TaxID=3366012 RepID=UPI00381D7888